MSIGYGSSINHEYPLSVSKDTTGDAFSTKDPSFVYGSRKYPYLPKKVTEFELAAEVGGLTWGV